MKKALAGLLASSLWLAIPAAADPAKEVMESVGARAKAYERGDADAWAASYAENAVVVPVTPFRLDGRAAIRADIANHFASYPGARRYATRQPNLRVYGDNLLAADGYVEVRATDRAGNAQTFYWRYSVVYAKLDGRWLIITQHNSALPGSPALP